MPTATESQLVVEIGNKLTQPLSTIQDCYEQMIVMASESSDFEFKSATMFACGRLEVVIATLQTQTVVMKNYDSPTLKLES